LTWKNGTIDGAYIQQMFWQMACCPERQWCDFLSFDPRIEKPELIKGQLFVKRIVRDDKKIKEMEKDVVEFLKEVNREVDDMLRMWSM
jgi:hypothetical protein